MNLRQLEVFYNVMRAGSITEASKDLGLSQPAVSMSLRQLEDRLGIKLFVRAGGRVKPTPEARLVFPDIQNVFERVETIARTLSNIARHDTGEVTLAVNAALLQSRLPMILSEFMTKFPGVKLGVRKMSSGEVVSRVIDREVDFGITYASSEDHKLQSEVIIKGEICCIVPEGHRLAGEADLSPIKLRGEPLITYREKSLFGGRIREAFTHENVRVHVQVEVNDAITAAFLAQQHHSIAVVVGNLALPYALSGVIVKPFRPAITFTGYLVHARDHIQSHATLALMSAIKNSMSGGTPNAASEPE